MFEQTFGAAQIAALLILLQRGLEEIYSARNTRALLAAGVGVPGVARLAPKPHAGRTGASATSAACPTAMSSSRAASSKRRACRS